MNITDLEKWKTSNLDLVQESLEKHNKAIILLAGASSSGKSYAGKLLTEFLQENGLRTFTISTDSYNRGISHIIVDKVNQNSFGGKLDNVDKLKDIAKDAIINLEFDDKFAKESLKEIAKKSSSFFVNQNDLEKYVMQLNREFKQINFDETSVYDLGKASQDVLALSQDKQIMVKEYSKKISEQEPTNVFVSGKDYDVIVLEGIYALDDKITKVISGDNVVSNFVLADEKTLFVRRVIRDSAFCPNSFTIKNYFERVLPGYKKDILPKVKSANIVLFNNMAFKELREGTVLSVHKREKIEDKNMLLHLIKNSKLLSKITFQDYYLSASDKASQTQDESQLIFRCASYDNGNTFLPYSLVQKGYVKHRKDGKVIRPVNVLLSEQEMPQVFKTKEDFFSLIKQTNFVVSNVIEKKRRRLLYKETNIVIDQIKNDGVYIELNGQDLNKDFANYQNNIRPLENDKKILL